MGKVKKDQSTEMHPLFPSGEWEGFYTYAMGPSAEQHKMHCNLTFKNSNVTGSGSDDVGTFSWKGSYDTEKTVCTMTKQYHRHTVSYQGQVDENGIWGSWNMRGGSGGFHIWPKSGAGQQQVQAKAAKAKQKVAEIPAGSPKVEPPKIGPSKTDMPGQDLISD